MKFSAADLVKKSASQILYFTLLKIQKEATPRQIPGITTIYTNDCDKIANFNN